MWPEEAIDLTEALRIYTANGARALRLDQQVGSITVGKSADLVVLNQNLFKISIDRVGRTKARMTYFEGNLVYTGRVHPRSGPPYVPKEFDRCARRTARGGGLPALITRCPWRRAGG